jgi:malic enzyme
VLGHLSNDVFGKSATGGARSNEYRGLDPFDDVEEVSLVGTPIFLLSDKLGLNLTEDVIREMAKHTDRPIIFPLSNPTRLAECKPEDAQKWTNGKALISTGSPFPQVDLGEGKKYTVAECNNALVYPGIGLGAILARATRVTDKMIVRAAQVLGDMAPASAEKPEASR